MGKGCGRTVTALLGSKTTVALLCPKESDCRPAPVRPATTLFALLHLAPHAIQTPPALTRQVKPWTGCRSLGRWTSCTSLHPATRSPLRHPSVQTATGVCICAWAYDRWVGMQVVPMILACRVVALMARQGRGDLGPFMSGVSYPQFATLPAQPGCSLSFSALISPSTIP